MWNRCFMICNAGKVFIRNAGKRNSLRNEKGEKVYLAFFSKSA